ncbi:MAG: PAS domain S-box protein, partial [Desulfobacteraceae bacterium]|nr:PAS domain S-box protein [Desulfobacteraceae bacterium]
GIDKNKSIVFVLSFTATLIIISVIFGMEYLRREAQHRGQKIVTQQFADKINTDVITKLGGAAQSLAKSREIIDLILGKTLADTPKILVALETAKIIFSASIVYIMDGNGTVISCTPYESGQTLTGKQYQFRPYFSGAMKGKNMVYAALGTTTKKRGLYFSSPIYHDKSQSPAGVVVIKISLLSIDKLFKSFNDPALLLSPDGIIFASNQREWLFSTAFPIRNDTREMIRKTRQFNDKDLLPLFVTFEKNLVTFNDIEYSVARHGVAAMDGWAILTLQKTRSDYPIYTVHKQIIYASIAIIAILTFIIIFLVFNISKRRIAENKLRESEERYRSVLEASPDAIVVYDMDDKATYVNPAFKRIFKWDSKEVLCKRIDFIPEENWIEHRKMMETALKEERFSDIESKRLTKGGDLLDVSISGAAYTNREGIHVGSVVNLRDITQQKNLKAQFIQSQKMEAVGVLAAGVAHDFNNLITAIQGHSDLLMMDLKEADPICIRIKKIRYASSRAAILTRQLLLFSRKQPMEQRSISLTRVVNDIIKMLRRMIGVDISIETDLETDIWTIKADPGNIEQVIMNLAINARDAMPEGGNLSIRTENIDFDDSVTKTISNARPGKFIRLSVADSGVGIDKAIMRQIFDPFFTTKEAGKGTGLGLSVIHGIVAQHNGWIDVYSEQNQGTNFNIYLPASPGIAEMESEKIPSMETLKGKGERVLVVEDDKIVREIIVVALKNNGYDVVEVEGAEDAIEIVIKKDSLFDLIVSDVVLQGMDGIKMAEQLSSLKPDLKLLLCSGYTDYKSKWPAIQEKGYNFLQKPFSVMELLKATQDAVRVKPI